MAIIGDYKNPDGNWAGGVTLNGVRYRTNAYSVWTDLKKRSRVCSGVAKHCPTYLGCSVSKEFENFQFFANWCHAQIGYSIEGYEIDKDILVPGNKEYHPDRCCFVPQALNTFISKLYSAKGIRPSHPGYLNTKFRVQVYQDGKPKSLGSYSTLEEAQAVYKLAKQMELEKWCKRLIAGEYPISQNVIEGLRKFNRD